MTLKELQEQIAKEIDLQTLEVLDIASNHHYSCKCETCRKWWIACGPDEDGCGSFTEDEIKGS